MQMTMVMTMVEQVRQLKWDYWIETAPPVGRTRMKQISASQFKARCLALLDEVAASGVPLQITKRGKALAELHPLPGAGAASPFGVANGGRILGELIEPLQGP
jgi:antitoxin (DNA-binding transcriptional repressor) of toxin-antitoxin stability system